MNGLNIVQHFDIMDKQTSILSSMSPNRPNSPLTQNGLPLYKPDANIHNFAPVARIMKSALPENAKIAKEAKECMQECVSEFISFITSEGTCYPKLVQTGQLCSNLT